MAVVVVAMVLAVGIWLMTLLAARGVLEVNGLVGIRTTATQRSPAAWQASHRAALPVVGWGGLVVVVAGALAITLGGRVSAPNEAVGLVLVVLEGVVTVAAAVVADRAARTTS